MIWLFLLLVSDPTQFQARMTEGTAAFTRGDWKAAEAGFEAAVRLQNDAAAWLMLTQTLVRENKSGRARQAAEEAERAAGNDPRILQALANLYATSLADLRKAAVIGAKYAGLAPEDRTAWRNVAGLYLEAGDPESAVAAARRGIDTGESADLHGLLGRALVERKEWSAAAVEFETATRLDPYNEDTRFRHAQSYLLQQDFTRAAAVLEDARKVFDKSPQIELALGVAYYGLRKFEPAVGQFLRTIALAPDVPQAYAFLGRLLEHAGSRLPEITQRFASFQERQPRSEMGYTLQAKALMLGLPPAGFPPEAEQPLALLEKALSIREEASEAHYLMGTLLERKRDFPAARKHLERSIQLNAGESAAHFRLARVYERLGMRDEAERERALHEKLSEAEGSAPPGLRK